MKVNEPRRSQLEAKRNSPLSEPYTNISTRGQSLSVPVPMGDDTPGCARTCTPYMLLEIWWTLRWKGGDHKAEATE